MFSFDQDTQGRLATVVFQEREEGQAQMDNLEEREKLERRAGLAPRETWERKVPKASGFNSTGVEDCMSLFQCLVKCYSCVSGFLWFYGVLGIHFPCLAILSHITKVNEYSHVRDANNRSLMH